jgi:hypothetical protein
MMMIIVPATIAAQNPSSNLPPKGKNRNDNQYKSALQVNDLLLLQKTQDNMNQHINDIGLSYDSITAITIDENDGIWVGSKNGLWVINGNLRREYTYKDGLFDKNIHDLYCSIEGQIWVATSTGPFALFDNHFYIFEPLKNKKVFTISENENNWLFLTEQGLSTFRKGKKFVDMIYVKSGIIMLLFVLLSALVFLGVKNFKTNVEWKANLIRAEQQALLAQMNPHFIFNSLNSVQRYIMANDKDSAHTYLQKFASMMRKVLENSSQSTITLKEEIATLDLYLQLESLRFDNGFDFNINVQDDDIWQLEIPTMLLQTFIENAVWHGLMNKESRGKIDIRFSKINKDLILCEIEDNGIGLKKAASFKAKDRIKYKSKGTEIVRKRIKLLNLKSRKKIRCETIDLEKYDTQRTGTLVRLTIPVAFT